MDSDNLKESDKLRIKEMIVESDDPNNENTETLISQIDDKQMFHFMKEALRSIEYENDFADIIDQYDTNPRVNAYYFIGLNVYLENYAKSIFKQVLENCEKKFIIDYAKLYQDKSNS